jgi:hypothetical protein
MHQLASIVWTIPTRGVRARLAVFCAAAMTFVWLSIEDNSALPVAVLGALLALTSGYVFVTGRYGGMSLSGGEALRAALLAGAGWGLGAALATASMMLLKNGVHAHLFPDYPFGMIVDVLRRAPLWALAGALAALGGLLLVWARRPTPVVQPGSASAPHTDEPAT